MQVRELNNESLHLSATYPGANAHVITQAMEEVHMEWEVLQAASLARKKKLRASSELQKFLSSVRKEGEEMALCSVRKEGEMALCLVRKEGEMVLCLVRKEGEERGVHCCVALCTDVRVSVKIDFILVVDKGSG